MDMRTPLDRLMYTIVADDIEATADFYTDLIGLKRVFSSDWFIALMPENGKSLEIGIIDRKSGNTPEAARNAAGGSYLTLIVEDVQAAKARAEELGLDILQPPTPLPYGQTQMLLRDPAGTIVDISTPTAS